MDAPTPEKTTLPSWDHRTWVRDGDHIGPAACGWMATIRLAFALRDSLNIRERKFVIELSEWMEDGLPLSATQGRWLRLIYDRIASGEIGAAA